MADIDGFVLAQEFIARLVTYALCFFTRLSYPVIAALDRGVAASGLECGQVVRVILNVNIECIAMHCGKGQALVRSFLELLSKVVLLKG